MKQNITCPQISSKIARALQILVKDSGYEI